MIFSLFPKPPFTFHVIHNLKYQTETSLRNIHQSERARSSFLLLAWTRWRPPPWRSWCPLSFWIPIREWFLTVHNECTAHFEKSKWRLFKAHELVLKMWAGGNQQPHWFHTDTSPLLINIPSMTSSPLPLTRSSVTVIHCYTILFKSILES